MENNLDEIAKGNYNWVSLVDNIYKSFHPKVGILKLRVFVPNVFNFFE